VARSLGLELSYIERLMKIGGCDEGEESPSNVVKLTKNFRSHNSILKYPNERFYKGELQQCGDPKVINAYVGSSQLVSKRFPIVFHAIVGKDDREASSPSFFNIDEILQVKAYVSSLKADRNTRSTDDDIGVISPYYAQCKKIRTALRGVADEVKVGSVEEFQGQERKVIIVSTVRSSREFIEYDLKHTLGFVANPRRFNVAITRAKALLIVVGDPSVLGLDPLWRSFLNFVHLNGGWRGVEVPWDPTEPVDEAGDYARGRRERAVDDMNEFARRMEELTLAGVEGAGGDAEDEEDGGAVDRPWREVE
jgi:helicase MOV-10